MKQRKRARVLASLAKSPMLVFAGTAQVTDNAEDLKQVEFTEHECASCGTKLAFGSDVEGVQPFCPTCGHEHFEAADADPVPVEHYEEDDLSLAVCPGCGAHNAFDDRVLAGLQGHVHCAACGCSLQTAAIEDEPEDVEEDEDIYDVNASEDLDDVGTDEGVEEAENLDAAEDETEAVEGDEAEAEEADFDEAEDLADDEDDFEEAEAEEETEAEDTADDEAEQASFRRRVSGRKRRAVKASDDTVQRLVLDDKPINTNPEMDSEPSASGVINTAPALSAETADEVEVDLLENANPEDKVSVVQQVSPDGETQLVAYSGETPVALLDKEGAGEQADVIGHRHFREALETEAAAKGAKCLSAYGFKPLTAKVQLAAIVQKRVQAALAESEEEQKADKEEIKKDFEQALHIAVAALNTGFYRNRGNPLASTLVASLEAMGVKQAKAVVKRAIAAASQEFLDETLGLTDELLAKDVNFRNELADTLSEVEPNALLDEEANGEAEEDEAPVGETVVARLNQGGRIVRPANKVQASITNLDVAALVAQARNTQTK